MPATAPAPLPDTPAQALDVLQRVFGYAAFRGTQQDIVEHVIDGGDALVLILLTLVQICLLSRHLVQ